MALKVVANRNAMAGEVIEEVMTLKEAGERLARSSATLTNQIKLGVFHATKSGDIYLTTASEVERYRKENLGRTGGVRAKERADEKRRQSQG
jgi:hypothetical protein